MSKLYRAFFALTALTGLACGCEFRGTGDSARPSPLLKLLPGSYDLVVEEVVWSSCGDIDAGRVAIPVELDGLGPVELTVEGWEFEGNYRGGLLTLEGHPQLGGGARPEPGVEEPGEPEGEPEEEVCGGPSAPAEDGDAASSPGADSGDTSSERPDEGATCPVERARQRGTLTLQPQAVDEALGLLKVETGRCSYSARVSLLPARDGDAPVVRRAEGEVAVATSAE